MSHGAIKENRLLSLNRVIQAVRVVSVYQLIPQQLYLAPRFELKGWLSNAVAVLLDPSTVLQ